MKRTAFQLCLTQSDMRSLRASFVSISVTAVPHRDLISGFPQIVMVIKARILFLSPCCSHLGHDQSQRYVLPLPVCSLVPYSSGRFRPTPDFVQYCCRIVATCDSRFQVYPIVSSFAQNEQNTLSAWPAILLPQKGSHLILPVRVHFVCSLGGVEP